MPDFGVNFKAVRAGGSPTPEEPSEQPEGLRVPSLRRLPLYAPRVPDHSTIEQVQRCPRKAFYSYWLRRSPLGLNYPIGWGTVYHKFRELIEVAWLTAISSRAREELLRDGAWLDDVRKGCLALATDRWEDPPVGHKKDWMTYDRLMQTLEMGWDRWLTEKRLGEITVLFTEQAFEIILPSGRPYGGRMDQIVEWNGKLWIRDFKTTSRMGTTFSQQFEPNNQMTGYTWAGKQISLRDIEGVIIEVPYNTKTKGPEFHQFLSTRSNGHLLQWIATVEEEMDLIERYYARTEAHGFYAWPMRTTACNDYGGCYYRGACQQEHPVQIERWLEANTKYSEWDFTNPEGEEGDMD